MFLISKYCLGSGQNFMSTANSQHRRPQSRQIHDRSKIALIDVFRDAFHDRDAKTAGRVHQERDGTTLTSELSRRATPRRLGVDEDTLRAHVIDHLSTLMNTVRLDAVVDLSDTPNVARSVLNFGFQDLSDLSRRDLIAPYIARSIRQSLVDHEPRLVGSSVDVRVTQIEGDAHQRIGVFVTADLIADPMNIAIEFQADVDVGAGKCVVGKTKRPAS